MKAVRIHFYGSSDTLVYEDALCPEPEGRNHRSLSSIPPSSPHLTQTAQVIPLTPKPTSDRTLSRRRGIILTEHGWQKLLQAEVLCNQHGERYTYEAIGERTLLDPRTISRILSRDVGVDRRTLKIFFTAFNLQLEPGDYTIPRPTKQESATDSPQHTSTKAELQELQQQIRQDCRRLIALMGLHDIEQATLSIKLSPHTSPQLELNIEQLLS